ncbi:MAG: sialidase family protein [bacterium]
MALMVHLPRSPRWLAVALVLAASQAAAHGGAPQVKHIRFPDAAGGAAWLMDELGLLARTEDGFTWLCDDSVSPVVGFEIVAPLDADRWVLSTRAGIFLTETAGCGYTQVPGPLTEHVTASLLPHPGRPLEFLTSTATLGILNDVYRSVDGGQTWTPAGLESTTRVRSLVRSEADPEVVFASHGAGASRSDDGGASFQPIALGPPAEDLPGEMPIRPEEFRFLATHPVDPGTAFAVVERFPASFLVRTDDGGQTWRVALAIEDSPDSLAFTRDGQRALMSTPFLGLQRSVDGGGTWEPVATDGIVGCLTREPATDRIWACGRGRPMQWVAAHTDDLGGTWDVALAQYADLVGTWTCPADSTTARACRQQCPPADPACVPPDAGVPGDASIVDGGVEPVDGAARDAGTEADAGPTPAGSTGGDDGCRATPGGAPALPWLLLLLIFRRRRAL